MAIWDEIDVCVQALGDFWLILVLVKKKHRYMNIVIDRSYQGGGFQIITCAVFLTTIRDPQKRAGLIELHFIYILKPILDQSDLSSSRYSSRKFEICDFH